MRISDAMKHVLWLIWHNYSEGSILAASLDGSQWRSFEALRRRGLAFLSDRMPKYNGLRVLLTDQGLALAEEIFPARGLKQR